MPPAFAGLRSLDLSWCTRVTDAALEYIACDLTQLEELVLDRSVTSPARKWRWDEEEARGGEGATRRRRGAKRGWRRDD